MVPGPVLDKRTGGATPRSCPAGARLLVTAFEAGLFGWMALMFFVFFSAPHLYAASPVYWPFIRVGMIMGHLP